METIPKQIQFNLDRLLDGITHFSKTTPIITALNHSLKTYFPGEVLPMETNGLPLIFQDNDGNCMPSDEIIRQWILKKGVEELIAGLTQTLSEAHRFIKVKSMTLNSEKHAITEKDLEDMLEQINNNTSKMYFPSLINEIETTLKITLDYKEEILSLNKLRNCLVHRNGIITKFDANDILQEKLTIKFRELGIVIETPEGFEQLTKEVKRLRPAVKTIFPLPDIESELIFLLGEEIKLDVDLYHAVLYTSVNFINALIKQMPISEELKNNLIIPYGISFATLPTNELSV